MTGVATLITGVWIVGLLLLNQSAKVRTSPALWLVVIWVGISTSRPVSAWLGLSPERSADAYLEGSPLDRNVFGLLLILGLCALAMRRRKVVPLLRNNLPLLVFFLYCAVSVLWSDFPDVAFKRWIKAIGDLVMILLILTESSPSAAVQVMFARTAFAFAPLSILFIRYFGDLGRAYSRWEGTATYTGIAADKNMLGMACLVYGLAMLWQVLHAFMGRGVGLLISRTQTRRATLAHGLTLILLLWLLVISNSMTALGCFVLASGLMVALSFPHLARKRNLVHFMVLTIISLVFLTLFVDLGGVVLEQMGRNPTLTGRTELWSDLFALASNPLFGTGFESFWLGSRLETLWRAHWWRPTQSHNGYIEIYLTLGAVGWVLLALVAIKGYRSILEMLRYDPVSAKLRLAFFVVAIAYNFTEAAFRTLHPVWLAFLLAVTVWPKPAMKGEAERRERRAWQLRRAKPARAHVGSYARQARLRGHSDAAPSL